MNDKKIYCIKYIVLISVSAVVFVNFLNAQVTDTIHVEADWNMVSLPLLVQNNHYLALFPDAISPALFWGYPYENDTLMIGRSYFIKFASAATYFLTGEPVHSVIINLVMGWNMVGSITDPVLVNTVKSGPPGIIISDFFKYNPASGYVKSDTIKPGSGYWVKVNQDGSIILSCMDIPCSGTPTVEYAGKTYNTVQIGNQCWFKENLNVGAMIPGSDTSKDNSIIEKYCYGDNAEYCNLYGGLYQWNEAMQYTTVGGAQGICPPGWHIPTLAEFQACSTAVGGNGNALKAIGQGSGDGAGTNTSGFSAFLAGYFFGDFGWFGGYGDFWGSTQNDAMDPNSMGLEIFTAQISLSYGAKGCGFSVRCLKD